MIQKPIPFLVDVGTLKVPRLVYDAEEIDQYTFHLEVTISALKISNDNLTCAIQTHMEKCLASKDLY